MSKADFLELVCTTEEYQTLEKQRVPIKDIWWYVKNALIYTMRNDSQFQKHCVYLDNPPSGFTDESNLDRGVLYYQRGNLTKAEQKCLKDPNDEQDWGSIRIRKKLVMVEDHPEYYQEFIPVVQQIKDEELKQSLLSLTPRKLEIIEMKVQGYSGVDIAKHLGISPVAVSKHLASIQDVLSPYHDAYKHMHKEHR